MGSSWSAIPVSIFSAVVGGAIILLLFADYFRRRRRDVQAMVSAAVAAPPSAAKQNQKTSSSSKPLHSRKPNVRPHRPSSAVDKESAKRHHPLDLNTLKGHGDSVTSVAFSSDAQCLATVCADGVARVFKLDDAMGKSFKFLRVNLPAGTHPTAVTFCEGTSSFIVAAQTLSGSSLYMYEEAVAKAGVESKQPAKLPLPEIKWEHARVHEGRAILTLSGTKASYGTADGSIIVASCSEGTDIKIWNGRKGNLLKAVDTNQLKNNMATVSPNGRFLAAAAFTADVKIWEIVYAKDGSVKEISNVMQLKGHKYFHSSSFVNSFCVDPSLADQISFGLVRYHLNEDPKTLKVFSIPLLDAKGAALHYDRLSVSPDGKIVAVTHGSTLQWLCIESGKVLHTAEKAHEGTIASIAWSPQPIPAGEGSVSVLATAGDDKKVKLWAAPALVPS
ncbi:unnamed protein product [Victoria cruziana]